MKVNLGLTPPAPLPAERLRLVVPSNGTVPINGTNVPVVAKSALDYNPRPLTRDINHLWSNQTKTSDVEFLLSCDNIDCLEKRADGWEIPGNPLPPQPILHAAGHFTIGGLANDPFASPGDPAFYLHHGQFDRVWAIWQAQDPARRLYSVAGTSTPFNSKSIYSSDSQGYCTLGSDERKQNLRVPLSRSTKSSSSSPRDRTTRSGTLCRPSMGNSATFMSRRSDFGRRGEKRRQRE